MAEARDIADVSAIRAEAPELIAQALASRRRARLEDGGRLLVIAADHPARGALAAGTEPLAMADRGELLERCAIALSRPGVSGFLGTADVVEDLALLGALEDKVVFGSMNRGGLAAASFEMDDRFTGYDASGIVASHLDGGKMLLRLDPDDSGSLRTLHACARVVDDLAAHHRTAIVEPFWMRSRNGQRHADLSTEAVIRSVTVAGGLGRTSAHSWLKLPAVPDMERVLEATSLPVLLLGGEVPSDPTEALASWAQALRHPRVRGMVIGRTLLYPRDDDVAAAVDDAQGLL